MVAVQRVWGMPGPLEQDANVVIPRGSSLTAAAGTLESQTVVVSALRFRILARFLGGGDPIKAGEFLIPAGSSAARDRKSVVSGKSVSVRVDLGGRRIIKKKNTTKPHVKV